MALDLDKIDLATLKAHSDDYLYDTQRQYETILRTLGDVRDQYAQAIVDYNNRFYEETVRLKNEGKLITEARSEADNICAKEFENMTKLEQTKKKLQGYTEGVKERLATIKILMKVRYSDLEGR